MTRSRCIPNVRLDLDEPQKYAYLDGTHLNHQCLLGVATGHNVHESGPVFGRYQRGGSVMAAFSRLLTFHSSADPKPPVHDGLGKAWPVLLLEGILS